MDRRRPRSLRCSSPCRRPCRRPRSPRRHTGRKQSGNTPYRCLTGYRQCLRRWSTLTSQEKQGRIEYENISINHRRPRVKRMEEKPPQGTITCSRFRLPGGRQEPTTTLCELAVVYRDDNIRFILSKRTTLKSYQQDPNAVQPVGYGKEYIGGLCRV